jgi:hypothetical protein
MSIRFFVCGHCRHKLRLGAENCGYCRQPTPVLNRSSTLATAAAFLLLVIYTAATLALA